MMSWYMYLGFLMEYCMFPGSNTARGRCECRLVRFDCSRYQIIELNKSSPGLYAWLFWFEIGLQWFKIPYSAPPSHPHHLQPPSPSSPQPLPHRHHHSLQRSTPVTRWGVSVPLNNLTREKGDVLVVLGATFPNMMRSWFPIGTYQWYHKPTCQKQSHKSRHWETIQ